MVTSVLVFWSGVLCLYLALFADMWMLVRVMDGGAAVLNAAVLGWLASNFRRGIYGS